MSDYGPARINMVESQLRPNKVTDPAVLAAFRALPREAYIPGELSRAAYVDEDVPLGGGRFLMEPMVHARLLQSAELRSTDRVLELGAGTGYGAAILARLAASVIAVESDPTLAARARSMLAATPNVTLIEQPLAGGAPDHGPFDAILLGGAIEYLPEGLLAQLTEGGRLVAVIRPRGTRVGQAVVVERVGSAISRRTAFDAGTPYLAEFVAEPGFAF